ncbi:MAG: substrate binding domain-containing protein [Acidiphilium sp.]
MQLEAHLRIRLIERSTRRQRLAAFGTEYFDRCRAILEPVEASETLATETRQTPRGRLRVAAPMIYGTFAVVPVVDAYLARNPAVEVELSLSDDLVDPLADRFDAALRVGVVESRGSDTVRALAPYRLLPCAFPGYLQAHGIPGEPRQLNDHSCLEYCYASGPPFREWAFRRGAETESVRIKGRLQINDLRALLHAARLGQGIVMAPEIAVAEDLALGALCRILPDYESPPRPVSLLYKSSHRLTPKLRAFAELVSRHQQRPERSRFRACSAPPALSMKASSR